MALVRDEQYYLNMGSDRMAMLLLKKMQNKFWVPGVVLVMFWVVLFLGYWENVFHGYLPENIGILMLVTAVWILYIFYYALIIIFHEVYAINEQLAGRMPEFKKLIHSGKGD